MNDMDNSVRDHARGHLATSRGHCWYVSKVTSKSVTAFLLHLRLTFSRLHEPGPGRLDQDARSIQRAG